MFCCMLMSAFQPDSPHILVFLQDIAANIMMRSVLSVCVMFTLLIQGVDSDSECTTIISDCYSAVVDIVFILDSSASVFSTDFTRMLHFTRDLVFNLNIDGGDARVGIITYSHTTNVEFYLSQYQIETELLTAIDDITHSHGLMTNTGEALKTMREEMFTAVHGDRPEVPNVALLITDGNSQQGEITKIQAKISKEAGIHIFAIGIGKVHLSELINIASGHLRRILQIDYTYFFAITRDW
ncbi:cartilage matrix protein-like [Pomacea canaliculata]|uniref:cartilage matrix protein-like n=1 Tax=Pomacea canaliculata TaxID=400727 RepID=UPI000D72D762|nr:cartilage matrix protein-like [Pomacea canaliculata]